MVFQNAQQVKIYNAFYDLGGSVVFYFVPAVYFALLLQFINFKAYNRDIFLMFLGFSFGILTLFIVPMQGWYYWIMPFFVYFFVRQISYAQHSFSYSFIALSILYLLFFFLIPQSDFTQIFQIVSPAIAAKSNLFHHFQSHGIDILRLVDVVFSVLQTCLLLCCIWIYTLGIRSNFKLKIQYQPYLIGVGGDSGAGKSTFAKLMEQVFQKKNISVIRGDDMHKWERGDTNWNEFTHLNPKANNLHEDMLHTASLKKGERIDRRHYDHNVGKFTLPEAVQSNKIVIFEGLHPFYLSKQSDIYDLKIFIRPQEELRVHWKVVRDMQKRGYTKDQVLQQLQKREEDSNKYIKVQEERANIIISFCLRTPLADLGNADEHADIFLRFRFDNNINVDPLLNALQQEASLDIRHDYDGDHQEFDLYGNVEAALIARLADEFIPELPDIGIVRPKWQAGYSGLIQLFTVYHIFYKMKIESL
jgi:uridine kinase